jgi:bifunctional UDP-N-acetylglucosamine pyrophosphorylase/glucosamine-1-phosphate N-acetyltransferase
MNLEVVILAAGQGTRMKSRLPKVLHPLAGRPLLQHVVDTATRLSPTALHIVVGHGADDVRAAIDAPGAQWVEQREQLGTGHAVMQALPGVAAGSVVLILYGDVPLTAEGTLRLLTEHAREAPALLTAVLADPAGYGRILRDDEGLLSGVVEEKDADPVERLIREVNTGVLAAPAADLMRYLPQVGNDNQQGEYYLPDVLSLAVADGKRVNTCLAETELDILGVNDRVQLNTVERELQRRLVTDLLRQGVHVADMARVDIRGSLLCGNDVSIDVNAVFEGEVSLGDGVTIGPNCVLRDVTVGDGTRVEAMSHLQESILGRECSIGPYARLRPGTVLGDGARVGNFVETKKALIGAASKVNHLSYIGDCEIGQGANVGAGTITCNYDGVNKHRTVIGDGAFVGSNSTLVAPVEVSAGAFVAAGSTITRRVGEEELAVSRVKQRNISGWKRPQPESGKN